MTYTAAMVDETSNIATSCRINDCVDIDTEEIWTSNANLWILSLSYVGNDWPNLLANIFDYHLIGCDWFQGKQTPIVDSTFREL